ncbi:PPC domain-containing DNA-binding protein [Roseiflexus sp.]|uniref:PPC domain-containing DNA-binding protein n=1 Tax=Roseiflexus sp. TaxID=2562120 RepID=UPI00398A9EB4
MRVSIVAKTEVHTPNRVIAAALCDGVNLHTALTEIAASEQITAAIVHMLGGLREVALVETDFTTGHKKSPLVFRRPLEIIGGSGMISRLNDAPHLHLHLTLSFQDTDQMHGVTVIGGHVAYALVHAVEALIICYDGLRLERHPDPATGLALWRRMTTTNDHRSTSS